MPVGISAEQAPGTLCPPSQRTDWETEAGAWKGPAKITHQGGDERAGT